MILMKKVWDWVFNYLGEKPLLWLSPSNLAIIILWIDRVSFLDFCLMINDQHVWITRQTHTFLG